MSVRFMKAPEAVFGVGRAGVAQLVEHLICNQRVGGSNPFASSTLQTRFLSPQAATNVLPALLFFAPGLSSAAIPLRYMLRIAGVSPDGARCAELAR